MIRRNGIRGAIAGLACICASLTIAACGGSGGDPPSAVDPATYAPASSVMYLAVTLRPQGQMKQTFDHLVNTFGGAGTTNKLAAAVKRKSGSKLNYARDIEPWLGQQVALVLVKGGPVPSNDPAAQKLALRQDFAVIAPTSDPSAAQKELSKLPGQLQASLTWKIVGNHLVFGGDYAVQQVLATTASTSLANSSAYKAGIAASGSQRFATMYERSSQLMQVLGALAPGASSQLEAGFLTAHQHSAPNATATITVSATDTEVRIDEVRTGVSGSATAPPADVSGLPSGSWLGAAANVTDTEIQSLQHGLSLIARGQAQGVSIQGMREIDSILPALGPLQLSVSGDSVSGLKAGFAITPHSQQAADKLMRLLYELAKHKLGPSLHGGPGGFTATSPTGAMLRVGHSGNKLVVTYGYNSPDQFLHPNSQLASDSAYKQALSSLPSGSRVPLYFDFDGLHFLAQLAKKPSDQKTWQMLSKLSYLILGEDGNHSRLVLALH